MKQFVKIHAMVKPSAAMDSLSELGLHALISAMLSIPDFEASNGGFKEALKKHCSDGESAFETSWKALKGNGYLKMMRMPLDHNQFSYRYELRNVPDLKTPAVQNMTADDARAYLSKSHSLYTAPQSNYTEVSWQLLMDNRLSLAAKGLYILIRREIDLARNLRIIVLKSNIMRKCREGKFAFNTAWKQLKDYDYLIQNRVIDPASGKINYEYELDDNPAEMMQKGKTAAEKHLQKKTPEHTANAVTDDEKPQTTPYTSADRQVVKDIVRENIQYADMLRYTRSSQGVYYTAKDLDGYVSLMTSAICTRKDCLHINSESVPAQDVRERLLSINYNHILYVMHSMENQQGIRNIRPYKLTALYNAVETIGDYESGYTI